MLNEATLMLITNNVVDNDPYSEQSSTNLSIAATSKTFVVPNTSKFFVGEFVTAYSRANTANYMYGNVTAFNTSTGDLTVNVTTVGGSGSHNDWDVIADKWSNGSWSASLGLSNLEDNRLGKKARSTNAANSSTILRLDFGVRETLDVICALRHNISLGAEVRWRLFDVTQAGNFSVVYDSAKIRAFPANEDFGDLPWGVFDWGGTSNDATNDRQIIHLPKEMITTSSTSTNTIGTGDKTFVVVSVTDLYEGQDVTLRDATNPFNCMLGFIKSITGTTIVVTVDVVEGSGSGLTNWLITAIKATQIPTSYKARFLQIDFFDSSNPNGYIEFGRLVVGTGWRPSVNATFGWDISYVDESSVARSLGGQPYFRRKRKYRKLNFTLNFIPRDEMFQKAFRMDREKGVTDPILVVFDPSDKANLADLTIYGTLSTLSPINNPSVHRYHGKSFSVSEWP